MSEQKLKHLGIIMDGNRRWAKERGLPAFEGHRAGYNKVSEVLQWCRDAGIESLTLYAFSVENWQRSKEEVGFLMGLFEQLFAKDVKRLHQDNVCVRVLGSKVGLSDKMQKDIEKVENLTKNNTGGNLNLAINYSGRQELVDAFNKILKNPPPEVTAEIISQNIYSAGLPDPDLIMRTSGENRLSGFLTWQSVYSELYFINHNWPEFSKEDFDEMLTEFSRRQRRFGK